MSALRADKTKLKHVFFSEYFCIILYTQISPVEFVQKHDCETFPRDLKLSDLALPTWLKYDKIGQKHV